MEKTEMTSQRPRYILLDEIRGITLLSMILFHAIWDLVYIFRVDWDWFYTDIAYIWQQSICWCFILLSGFCWSLGKRKLYRGGVVFGCGILISVITEIFTPMQRIRFGVLTFLGVSMLLTNLLEKILKRIPCVFGFTLNILLFVITRNLNEGCLGFEGLKLYQLPKAWYDLGDGATFLGLTDIHFFSADYFSIFPWYFLFLTGYFLYRWMEQKHLLERLGNKKPIGAFWSKLGKNSLVIYLLHQPVVYLTLLIVKVVGILPQ